MFYSPVQMDNEIYDIDFYDHLSLNNTQNYSLNVVLQSLAGPQSLNPDHKLEF